MTSALSGSALGSIAQAIQFHTQYQLPLTAADDEIIVDYFCGGGGAGTGLEMGLSRPVAIAKNHDEAAISMHSLNHPQAVHLHTDVFDGDPLEETGGRRVGWFHMSPDCRHHSQAKGGQPRVKAIRDLSWIGCKWAGRARPRLISLENVVQILDWSPLIAKRDKATGRVIKLVPYVSKGKQKTRQVVAAPGERVPLDQQYLIPNPSRKGETWRRFVRQLEGLGYKVEWRAMRGCDYGAPTIRKRLYMIARCDGQPIVWPEPTHHRHPKPWQAPWPQTHECIDWSILSQSIFDRNKPLADATLCRVAKGVVRYVLDCAAPFIVPMASPVLATPGQQAAERQRFAGFLVQANGGFNNTPAHDLRRPVSTITSTGSQQQLVTTELAAGAWLSPQEEAGALRVAAFLMQYYSEGGQWGALDKPLHTITTKDRLALVTVYLAGDPFVIVDICLRMLQPHELYRAQGFPANYVIDRGHNGRQLTKTEQVRMCGNSVCPPVMAALAYANDPWRHSSFERLAA